MSPITYFAISGISIIPILASLLFPKNKEFFQKNLVRGFGLGVYLMVVVLLLREAIEQTGFATGGFLFIIGLTISLLIGVAFKEFHHHHNDEEKAHSHNKSSIWRVLISDFFHNIVDGIAIIASFAVNTGVGITSFLGILGHQTIQQAGQQVLLVENKINPSKAILISFIVSLSIFLSFVFKDNKFIEVIFISLSAGIVAWKVAVDMMHAKWNKKMIVGFMIGAILLALILVLVPHEN
ncbi:ZIP family metal transporter [Candidatus Nomurabacteria bacterium]|nr:ZIP family metal transporter [Candidatus Nomurabacteria bacterium]